MKKRYSRIEKEIMKFDIVKQGYFDEDIVYAIQCAEKGMVEEYQEEVKFYDKVRKLIGEQIMPWFEASYDIACEELEGDYTFAKIAGFTTVAAEALTATLLREHPDAALVLCGAIAGGGLAGILGPFTHVGIAKKNVRTYDKLLYEWYEFSCSLTYIKDFVKLNNLTVLEDDETGEIMFDEECLEQLYNDYVYFPAETKIYEDRKALSKTVKDICKGKIEAAEVEEV